MNSRLKKVWPMLATSLLAFTSVASAADDMQMRNLENRVNALEQRRGTSGMINPPARPVVKDGVDLWIEGEALYMKPTEDGLGFAANSDSTAVIQGDIKNARYPWSWGFRAGAGYNLPHDGWDFFLNWTWLRSSETTSMSATSVFPTELNPDSANASRTALATDAHAHLALQINLLDFEMGREFFVSKWMTIRPHMGVRAGWVHRQYKVHYTGGSVLSTSTLHDNLKNRFSSAGLRGGFDTQFGLGSGWSIFGQMAFSLLYGNQHLRYSENLVTVGGVSTNQGHVRDNWLTVRPMTDFALGFRWDKLFYDDRFRFRIQLGWEEHTLFGFTKDIDLTDDIANGKHVTSRGDLSFSGLALQARFDF
jgi:hypothetical protein